MTEAGARQRPSEPSSSAIVALWGAARVLPIISLEHQRLDGGKGNSEHQPEINRLLGDGHVFARRNYGQETRQSAWSSSYFDRRE
jgi:hypothetical protein